VIKLLISIGYVEELSLTYKYKQYIDILDLKNVRSGEALGCPTYDLIKRALENKFTEISVPIGDLYYYSTNVVTLAEIFNELGVDYVKAGICMNNVEEITRLVHSLRDVLTSSRLVVAGFGDYYEIKSIDPIKLFNICRRFDIDVMMLDTKIKNGLSIIEKYGIENIIKLREECKAHDMMFAIAGGLKLNDIVKIVREVYPDVIGVRSILCNERSSIIVEDRLKEVINIVKFSPLKLIY